MDRRRLAAVALGVAALVAVVGSFAIRPQGASAQSSASVAVDSVDARGESIVVDGSVVGADAASLSFRVGTAPASGATAVGSQVPLDVVAVIDNSANLRNGTVQLAKQAVAQLMPGRGPAARLGIVTTSGGADTVIPLTASADAVTAALDTVQLNSEGGSDTIGAVARAASMFDSSTPETQRVVVMIAATPDLGGVGLGEAESTMIAAGATLHAVLLNKGVETNRVAELVRTTGGSAAVAASDEAFDDEVGRIVTRFDGRFRSTITAPGDVPNESMLTAQVGDTTRTVTMVAGTVRRGDAALVPPVAETPGAIDRIVSHPAMLWVVVLLGVAAVVVAAWTLLAMFLGRADTVSGRLAVYDEHAAELGMPDGPPVNEVTTVPILKRAVALTGDLAERRGILEQLEADLERANLPLRAAEALFFALVGGVLAAILVFLLTKSILMALVVLVVAALLPKAVINFRIGRRTKAFEQQLPDMLDLLAGTLRAGYSIGQGIEAVSREIGEPMSRELQRVVNEHRLGRSLEESLEGVAERMQSDDFAWAVMAIRIQREVGGNLAELLLTVSNTMTQRERLRRDVASLTAEGKMSAMVLGLMPFILGMVMFVINKQYVMALLTPGLGYMMLGGALVSMVIGFIWMKKMITVEV